MAAAAVPIVMGVMGAIQGAQQQRDTARSNKALAEGNRFADVTGHRNQMQADKSGGALGGGLRGAAAGMSFVGDNPNLFSGGSQQGGGVMGGAQQKLLTQQAKDQGDYLTQLGAATNGGFGGSMGFGQQEASNRNRFSKYSGLPIA